MSSAKLKIRTYPDSVLKKKCEDIKEITPELKELIKGMITVAEKDKGAAGLAAPQVGVSKRLIVVDFMMGQVIPLINPKITKKSKQKIIDIEGCLSFPKLFLQIKRAREVEIEAINEKGEKIRLKAKDLPARILQHEIDHLNGILFIDRVDFWKKFFLRKKLSQ